MFEKRLLAAAIVAGLGIGLTACGSGSSSGAEEEIETGIQNPSPGGSDATPGAGGEVAPAPTPETGGNGATTPEAGTQPDEEQPTGPETQPEPEPQPDPEPEPQPEEPAPGSGDGSTGDGGVAPGPSAGGGESAASACALSAASLQPGARWLLEYRNTTTISGTPAIGTMSQDGRAVQRTSFAGHSAVEIERITTQSLPGLPTIGTHSWSYEDLVDGNVVEQYGHRTSTAGTGFSVDTVSTYAPAWRDLRFTLNAGQTANYSYTMQTVTTTNAMGTATESGSSHSASGSWTFHGMDTVSVPAGTFSACKFTRIEGGSTSVEWLLTGLHFVVKSVSNDKDGSGQVTLELTSGSFNGTPIRP